MERLGIITSSQKQAESTGRVTAAVPSRSTRFSIHGPPEVLISAERPSRGSEDRRDDRRFAQSGSDSVRFPPVSSRNFSCSPAEDHEHHQTMWPFLKGNRTFHTWPLLWEPCFPPWCLSSNTLNGRNSFGRGPNARFLRSRRTPAPPVVGDTRPDFRLLRLFLGVEDTTRVGRSLQTEATQLQTAPGTPKNSTDRRLHPRCLSENRDISARPAASVAALAWQPRHLGALLMFCVQGADEVSWMQSSRLPGPSRRAALGSGTPKCGYGSRKNSVGAPNTQEGCSSCVLSICMLHFIPDAPFTARLVPQNPRDWFDPRPLQRIQVRPLRIRAQGRVWVRRLFPISMDPERGTVRATRCVKGDKPIVGVGHPPRIESSSVHRTTLEVKSTIFTVDLIL